MHPDKRRLFNYSLIIHGPTKSVRVWNWIIHCFRVISLFWWENHSPIQHPVILIRASSHVSLKRPFQRVLSGKTFYHWYEYFWLVNLFIRFTVCSVLKAIVAICFNDFHMCSSRCAEASPAIYWPEGTVLPRLLYVWFGNRSDRPVSKHCGHADVVQCVWSYVQHSLHHPIQPHLGVPQGWRGQW